MAQGKKTQRRGSVFSYGGRTDYAAWRKGQVMVIRSHSVHHWLAEWMPELRSGAVWAEKKGGWQQKDDGSLGRVEGKRNVLSPRPSPLREYFMCTRGLCLPSRRDMWVLPRPHRCTDTHVQPPAKTGSSRSTRCDLHHTPCVIVFLLFASFLQASREGWGCRWPLWGQACISGYLPLCQTCRDRHDCCSIAVRSSPCGAGDAVVKNCCQQPLPA